MAPFAASVIISFYENTQFLEKVLAGYSLQDTRDFEILIADDGSGEAARKKVAELIGRSGLSVHHVWHQDTGWRKNKILSQAVLEAGSQYLIFTDGDCIPHHAFVREHLESREPGAILAGRRVYLGQGMSHFLTAERIRRKYLKRYGLTLLLADRIFGTGRHIENGLYFRNRMIRNRINKKDKGVLGSNFSLHKQDFLAVNGFDERYQSPAVGEDTDLEIRLRNDGIRVKSVKHLAIQYHLFHKTLERDPQNQKLLDEVIREKSTYTPYGINR